MKQGTADVVKAWAWGDGSKLSGTGMLSNKMGCGMGLAALLKTGFNKKGAQNVCKNWLDGRSWEGS